MLIAGIHHEYINSPPNDQTVLVKQLRFALQAMFDLLPSQQAELLNVFQALAKRSNIAAPTFKICFATNVWPFGHVQKHCSTKNVTKFVA